MSEISVSIGNFSAKPIEIQLKISAEAREHEDYEDSTSYNDIAVLKLSKEVSSDRVLPICTKDTQAEYFAVCGMGQINNAREYPDVLQEVVLVEKRQLSLFLFLFSEHKGS